MCKECILNKSYEKAADSSQTDNSTTSSFFLPKHVESSCNKPIKIIFQTLLLEKKSKQQALADFCNVDKAYISRVVNGIYVPELRMKLKIASFFGVDTGLIWREK